MIEINNGLFQAAKAKYNPDLLAEVDKYIGKLESASGKLNALGEHFTSSKHKPKELLVERQPGE